MDVERTAIVDCLSRPEMKDAHRSVIKYQIKNAEESIKARKEGNDLYIKKEHTKKYHTMIMYFYNKSIAYAPSESEELMLAYSNKAYLLMHLNKYNEAIDSLDKALKLANSTKGKIKLYCQKVKCLAALGSSMKDDLLKKIDDIFKKSKLSIEDTMLVSNIIEKTKSAVVSMKQFKPINKKFLQEKNECNKIITDKEKDNPFDFVEIKSTENMGRGLYAKTDFKTGDLVLVEKPCLIGPNFSNPYIFCSHCLCIAWTVIPCETCHDYIFCSLQCKNMAWEEYHHIDCSIIPYLILLDPEVPFWTHMSLKFMITIMKDYKTINEFRSKLSIFGNTQAAIVNDEPQEKVNFINKLMELSYDLPKQKNHFLTPHTIKTLICAVKYTSFFSEKFKGMQYDDLSKNEDFIFIGSLLLRLVKIRAANFNCVANSIKTIPGSSPKSNLNEINDEIRGFGMGLISSMINHSCAPNIRKCFSDGMKYVYYALEPIARGTQLLDTYSTFFYNSPSMHRRLSLANFVCKCIACEENWPALIFKEVGEAFMEQKMKSDAPRAMTELSFLLRINPLSESVIKGKYDKNLIKTFADMMEELAVVLPKLSLARSWVQRLLDELIEKYYGLTEPFENCCSK